MDFEHAAIALLASMVLVLAGIVGWIYWQQTRMFQNMNNIVSLVGELAQSRYAPEPEAEPEVEVAAAPEPEKEEDDRVSVQEDKREVDVVEGPLDTDNLDGKTKKELQDMLTTRGIPFGKGDNKTTLISLLKATA